MSAPQSEARLAAPNLAGINWACHLNMGAELGIGCGKLTDHSLQYVMKPGRHRRCKPNCVKIVVIKDSSCAPGSSLLMFLVRLLPSFFYSFLISRLLL